MKATRWEFANRAMVIGLIFGLGFACQSFDHENVTAALANWIEGKRQIQADLTARILFVLAALLLAFGAFLRTWASSYLKSSVVYASEVKTEVLVADGPYRYVRNPLYLANIFMAIAFGAMMSRSGIVLCVVLMVTFSYRLILREESDMVATRGSAYDKYRRAVPRLWPAFSARIPSAGSKPDWMSGFKAEFWCWGFALALAVFAATLQLVWYFAAVAASLVVFWVSSTVLLKRG